MSLVPETRPTLIHRLQHASDETAWEEFVAIYRPVIVRLTLRRGIQAADAEDVAQQVLLAVAKSINKWREDDNRAHFRTWLQVVVRNIAINTLARMPRDRAHGGTTALQNLNLQPVREESEWFDAEWRRQTVRWVAAQIRDEFEPATWTMFWETAIEGLPASDVALKADKSVGAVYIARSRVMQRIKQKIEELDQP